jgi:hypothetical protein
VSLCLFNEKTSGGELKFPQIGEPICWALLTRGSDSSAKPENIPTPRKSGDVLSNPSPCRLRQRACRKLKEYRKSTDAADES